MYGVEGDGTRVRRPMGLGLSDPRAYSYLGGGNETQDQDGHCFDKLFAGEALADAEKLPRITTCASLRRVANRHAKPFSDGLFSVVAGLVQGQPVWHVTVGELSAETCLYMMDKTSLVGVKEGHRSTVGQSAQDVVTEVHAVAPVVTSEATSVDVSGVVLRRRFQWSLTLTIGPGEPDYAVINPTTIPRIVNVSKLFESVRLMASGVILSVSAGTDTIAGIAFGKQGFGPTDMGALRARPNSMVCYGRTEGWTRHFWDLPDRHNFGRDYKMINPGNPVGHVAIKLLGTNRSQVDVDGYFDIEFGGEGIVEPMRLKPSDYSGKAAARGAAYRTAATIANSGQPLKRNDAEAVADEEEDDDDSE